MKIKAEHFDHMKTLIDAKINEHGHAAIVSAYNTGNFPRSDRVKDLQKRLCFDLLNASVPSKWICDNIYDYANDDHIYTALRVICPKVARNY